MVVLVAVLSACAPTDDAPPPDRELGAPPATVADPAVAGTYTATGVEGGGSIRGTVFMTGVLPPPRTVAVTEGIETCGPEREIQAVQVGGGGELRHAVVSLADIARGKAPEPGAVAKTLDQRGCEFVPHMLLVAPGESIRVLNSDPLTHNLHTASFENRSINRTQPVGGGEIELSFTAPERVRVRCDLHPWMSAWVIVTEHPYYAITDPTGTFVLSNVPPGTYTMEIWHEAVGTSTQTVTVVANDTAVVRIELAMPR
jgi:plastocyanin